MSGARSTPTQRQRRHPDRLGPAFLGRRRFRDDPGDDRRFRDPRPRLEGGARPRLQRDQLLQADRQRDARRRGRRGPGGRVARRHLDRRQGLPHHRRPYAPRRRRRRSRRDHLAAAVRHGEGEILSAALRPGARRGGGAHRPGQPRRRRCGAGRQGGRGRDPARRGRAERDPLDQIRAQQLAAPGRARPSTPRSRSSSWASAARKRRKGWPRTSRSAAPAFPPDSPV